MEVQALSKPPEAASADAPKRTPQTTEQHDARLKRIVKSLLIEIIQTAADASDGTSEESASDIAARLHANVLYVGGQVSVNLQQALLDTVCSATIYLRQGEEKPPNSCNQPIVDTSNPRNEPQAADKKARALWT